MLFILDIDRQRIVTSAGSDAEATTVTGKRSTAGLIAIQIVQGGNLAVAEVDDLLLKFVAKDVGEYDQTPQVSATAFTWSTARLQYEATVNWNTTTLNARFGVQDAVDVISSGNESTEVITTSAAHGLAVNDRVWFPSLTGGSGITAAEGTWYYVKSVPSTTTFTLSATLGGATLDFTTAITAGSVRKDPEDVASIELAVELGWRFDAGDPWYSSENEITLTLRNNYIRDDDGTPDDPEDAAALTWLDENAVMHSQAQSLTVTSKGRANDNMQILCGALTGGGSSPLALDALITLNVLTTGFCAFVVTSNIFSVWQLQSGTTAEDSANGIVRPDDYHATNNARIWIRVL